MSAERKAGICDLGPIRPPSESTSLLIRVTRNCPWNKCLFCPVYKGRRFEKRTEEDVIREIDLLADTAERLRRNAGVYDETKELPDAALSAVVRNRASSYEKRRIALWLHRGGRHAFFQDADSLVRPAHRIEKILRHLYKRFPMIDRVCTYARSRTLTAKTLEELKTLRAAGLTRIHVGVESGSDAVLKLVAKGCNSAHHIEGVKRAVDAGFEVCCYVMPGLGGRALSDDHVQETARVLKASNPHHIRLRTMFLTADIPLYEKVISGEMSLLEEDEVILEIQKLLSLLRGANGKVLSDHEHNLLMNINGHLTDDAKLLDARLTEFLDLPKELRDGFIAARRSGHFYSLSQFLADAKAHDEMIRLALSIRQNGQGSLLKGMVERFPPKLV
jgi:radical SAM superfamily enzyme YgiQ (UPF0313 family)